MPVFGGKTPYVYARSLHGFILVPVHGDGYTGHGTPPQVTTRRLHRTAETPLKSAPPGYIANCSLTIPDMPAGAPIRGK